MKWWRTRLRILLLAATAIAIIGLYAVYSFFLSRNDVPGVARDTIQIDDTHAVSFLRAGAPGASRIIFVHGSPGGAAAWRHYMTNPIPGFESIAIDRFGYGGSMPKAPEPSLEEQARAIAPLLIERHGKWPVLVGHSLGGTIICQAAVDNPGKVGGLVILAGALSPGLEKIHWYQRVADFWVVPSLLPADITTSNRELLPLKGELEKLSPRLGEIACPIAIVHGKRDILVPVANVAFMQERFRSDAIAEVTVLPNENHFLPWTVEPAIRETIVRLAAVPPLPGQS